MQIKLTEKLQVIFVFSCSFFAYFDAAAAEFETKNHQFNACLRPVFASVNQNSGSGSFFSLAGAALNYSFFPVEELSAGLSYSLSLSQNSVVLHGPQFSLAYLLFGGRSYNLNNSYALVSVNRRYALEIGGGLSTQFYNFASFGVIDVGLEKTKRKLLSGAAIGPFVFAKISTAISSDFSVYAQPEVSFLGSSEQKKASLTLFSLQVGSSFDF